MCSKSKNEGTSPGKKAERNREGVVLPRLRRFRLKAGFSQQDLADFGVGDGPGSMSRTTISAAECGKEIDAPAAQRLADKLSLKLEEPVAVSDLMGEETDESSSAAMAQWRSVGDPPGPFTLAPNGLQWRVQKLEHTLVRNRFGRGKFYDLSHLSSKNQHEFQAYLVARHAEVCDRVGAHPNLARNYDVFQDRRESSTWWVVDEWLEGCTLADSLERGPLPRSALRQAMLDIASGLAGLHTAGVIRRNLTPESVMMTENRAVLTDFELARLPGNVPTVSANAKWREDAYLAPEVPGAGELKPGTDLYSWSVVLAHSVAGVRPETPGQAKTLLSKSGLPKKVVNFALRCLRPANERPQTVAELLSVLRKWS